jgi:hypothetical protein
VKIEMLMQGADASLIFIIGLLIATIIATLVLYLSTRAIESKHKASDKKIMILLVAFIAVLLLPVIASAIGSVLSAIGNILAELRNALDGGGANFLTQLQPILYFLMLLVLVKWLIDVKWENAVWIALLTLFIMYIMYCIIPELYIVIQLG